MYEESESIPDSQKEIINSIFLDLYGQENTFNYTLAVCINNYDKPMCKEEVKARLHNSNKASIKIFECLTGLKLPNGYKKRMEYLENICFKDFQDMKEYKPRKKRESKENVEEDFYMLMDNFTWKKVIAEPIKKYGIEMFAFIESNMWKLSHVKTGLCISSGKTKNDCLESLKFLIDTKGKEEVSKMFQDKEKIIFERAGENPLFNNHK